MFTNLKDAPLFDGLRSLFKGKQPEVRRWIVLDVETSGLNPYSDRLLAIAAVALDVSPNFEDISIVIGDSYEAVLKQDLPSNKDNILIHHIGTQAQSEGRPPLEVLEEFRAWLGQSPLLAFHAAFDEAMLGRAYGMFGLRPLQNEWLDIEPLAKITGVNPSLYALDDWLGHFGIERSPPSGCCRYFCHGRVTYAPLALFKTGSQLMVFITEHCPSSKLDSALA